MGNHLNWNSTDYCTLMVSKRICKNDIRMTKQLNAVCFNARVFK